MASEPDVNQGLPPAGAWDPAKKFFVALVVLGGLAIIAFFSARPAYHLLRGWRGAAVADEIDELLAQEPVSMTEVGRRLKVALELAPNDPRILRQSAVFLTKAGNEGALNYYEMLMARGLATHEERLDYVGLALDFNQLEKAQAELTQLLKASPRDLTTMRLSIRLLQQKGDQPRAILAARATLGAHPTSEPVQLTLGTILLQGTNSVQRDEGRRLLLSLALSTSPLHERAVDTLTLSTNLTRGESELLARELLARTNVTILDRLGVGTLRLRIDPDKKAEIIRSTIEQAGPLTATNSLLAVGSWLWRLGEHEALLEVIPRELAQTNSPLLALRLESLAELGRWSELQPYLDAPASALHPVYLHCLRGVASVRNGRPQDAPAHFEMAMKAAERSNSKLMFVARFAEVTGLPELAIEAWKPLLTHPGTALRASREIVRIAGPLDDLRVSRDVFRRVTELAPSDPGIRSHLAYLNLMLGDRVDSSRNVAQRLVEEHPDEAAYRYILALAELRGNNPGAALSVLEQRPIEWDTLDERWRAVYVAALGANNQREAARQFARKVNLDRLKSVERDLVKPWL
jgi:hypothetical protein